ncbi:hypothetical protein [Solidesulfovibrio carbinolicus]|uniref:hypothetical protein n=1 Tax=Solidesulfovibrio carbinolicus TaxID=296842 RepID=UPI00101310EC|nr:hypothetical protein [Solidesulfovibrio carbinolicus]
MRGRDRYTPETMPYGADMLNWELIQNLRIKKTPSARVSLSKSVSRLADRGLVLSVWDKEYRLGGCNITAEGVLFIESTYPKFSAEIRAKAATSPWINKGGFRLSTGDWRKHIMANSLDNDFQLVSQ